MDGGILKWYSANDSGSTVADNILVLDHGTGNVGIGIAPTHKLHLSDASRVDIKFSNTNDDDHYIRKDGDYLRFRGHDDSTVIFELRNNQHSNVASFPNGKVGIGLDNPSTHNLEIAGSTNGEHALLKLSNTNTGSSAYAEMDIFSSTANLRIGIADPSYSGFAGAAFIRNQTNGQVRLGTGSNNNVLTVDNNGGVGIGTTSPYTSTGYNFISVNHATNGGGMIMKDNEVNKGAIYTAGNSIYIDSIQNIFFRTGSTPPAGTIRMWMDNNQVNISPNAVGIPVGGQTNRFGVHGSASTDSAMAITRFVDAGTGPSIRLGKSRSDTVGTYTAVTGATSGTSDALGTILWYGADGTDMETIGAYIDVRASANAGSNNVAARMTFWTNHGSAAASNRMTIAHNGKVGIGTEVPTGNLHVLGSQMDGVAIEDSHASGNPRILLKAASGRVGYIRQQTAGANGVQANWYATNDANNRAFSIATSGGFGDSSALFMVKNVNGGDVGIGTHAPSYALHVEKASGTTPRIYVKSNGSDDAILDVDAANDVYMIMRRAGTAKWAFTNNHAPGTDTLAIYNYVRNKNVMSFQMGGQANDVVAAIGCNPTSNWYEGNSVLMLGGHGVIFSGTTGAAGQSMWVGYNTEQRNSSFNAINEDEGSYIEQQNGNIMFKTAPSVTAGSAQTFTERFRIALAGQLGIGGANYGTDGQVLTSTGASTPPAWEDAGGGGGVSLPLVLAFG